MELPVARAADPSGAPHAVDRGAERYGMMTRIILALALSSGLLLSACNTIQGRGQGHQIRE